MKILKVKKRQKHFLLRQNVDVAWFVGMRGEYKRWDGKPTEVFSYFLPTWCLQKLLGISKAAYLYMPLDTMYNKEQ